MAIESRVLVCADCEKEFDRKSNYTNHVNKINKCKNRKYIITVIDNSNQYRCKLCNKIYKYLSNFYKHYNKIHKNKEDDTKK